MAARITERQKAFCDFYIETLNATEAARRAGYSKKTSKEIGAENLTKPHLVAYIDKRLEELKNERTADASEVLEYLTSVMRGESVSEVVVTEGQGAGESQARVVKKKPDEKERTKAAELLGKRYTLFSERLEMDANVHSDEKLAELIDAMR